MFAGKPGDPHPGMFPECIFRDSGTTGRICLFFLVLGALFFLDIVTTDIILLMGGAELNPLMAGIVTNPALHSAIKVGILLLVFGVSIAAEVRVRGTGILFYGVLITLCLVVVANNLLYILPRLAG
ncbi:MAG: hypothetical protein GYA23_03125 [Methanomicrobiales archaeon]|nr:hypothetical protein [Methanomicrobiales archaeon]